MFCTNICLTSFVLARSTLILLLPAGDRCCCRRRQSPHHNTKATLYHVIYIGRRSRAVILLIAVNVYLCRIAVKFLLAVADGCCLLSCHDDTPNYGR